MPTLRGFRSYSFSLGHEGIADEHIGRCGSWKHTELRNEIRGMGTTKGDLLATSTLRVSEAAVGGSAARGYRQRGASEGDTEGQGRIYSGGSGTLGSGPSAAKRDALKRNTAA